MHYLKDLIICLRFCFIQQHCLNYVSILHLFCFPLNDILHKHTLYLNRVLHLPAPNRVIFLYALLMSLAFIKNSTFLFSAQYLLSRKIINEIVRPPTQISSPDG